MRSHSPRKPTQYLSTELAGCLQNSLINHIRLLARLQTWRATVFSRVCLCVCVCVWPAILPFNVDRFWWNLVTRTPLWSSLAATIMVQIGRRGTAQRLFENFKKSQKSQNSNFKILVHQFCVCLLCIVKNRLDSNKTDGGDTFWSMPLSP